MPTDPFPPSVLIGTFQVIKYTKCTALIGAAAVAGAFTPAILRLMAEQNDTPLIMALSNPTPVAECTAEQAYRHTGVSSSVPREGDLSVSTGTLKRRWERCSAATLTIGSYAAIPT